MAETRLKVRDIKTNDIGEVVGYVEKKIKDFSITHAVIVCGNRLRAVSIYDLEIINDKPKSYGKSKKARNGSL